MALSYEEWQPGAALRGVVTAYWRVDGDGEGMPNPAVLPDGHVELVFNRGDPVALAGPAFTGDQPARAVVGPLSRAIKMTYGSRVDTFGVRFHPARGAGFFGVDASELADRVVPLAELAPALDARVAPDRGVLDDVLAVQLESARAADAAIVELVDTLAGGGDERVAELAAELGLSPRQLQRRFLSAVGIAPKRFVRVMRFARVWQLATMSAPEAWAELAIEHGYADQAHMVRDFRAFGAEPPTRQFSPQWYAETEVARTSGPAAGVRSVQDRKRGRER